ncbi:MAG: hypothetical protein WBI91_02705 [Coriobacteriia bacterium]
MGLARTHVGWENEHLATFLLSRVSFVASPATVADDVGTDLFCTLFERTRKEDTDLLVPRSSIAVQVKSSRKSINVAPQLEYLARLEIPYYVGVVNQKEMALDLFSGRFLPLMLSYRGRHSRLDFVLVDELSDHYRIGDDATGYKIECPRVTTLCANDDPETRKMKAELIRDDAALGLKAIASRLNREYIFNTPNGLEIFTGSDSATTFRSNFFERYAEALHNLAWLLENHQQVSDAELDAYLSVYDTLVGAASVPDYVGEAWKRVLAARETPA